MAQARHAAKVTSAAFQEWGGPFLAHRRRRRVRGAAPLLARSFAGWRERAAVRGQHTSAPAAEMLLPGSQALDAPMHREAKRLKHASSPSQQQLHPTTNAISGLTDVADVPVAVPAAVLAAAQKLRGHMSSAVQLLASMRAENKRRLMQQLMCGGSSSSAASASAQSALPPTPAAQWMPLQSPFLEHAFGLEPY